MGQISIPMLNKVGYSMYWNSMWDNKVNFSRSLKEDIYLNRFIPLLFNDCISAKIFKYSKKNIEDFDLYKYRIHLKIKTKNEFFLYSLKNSKLLFYPSKVWILKYQKWLIIFFFMYNPKFNKLKNKQVFSKKNLFYDDNIFNLFILYKKANVKINFSYNFFDNQIRGSYF